MKTHFPQHVSSPEQAGQLARDMFHHDDWQNFDRGTVSMDEVIERTSARLSLPEQAVDALVSNIGELLTPMQDTLAGRHTFQIDTLGSSKGFVDAGRLKILAVCDTKRAASMPDVPTVQERTGIAIEVVTWNLIFAPAGTPRPIVDRLNAAINQAIKHQDMVEKARVMGIDLVESTPASSKKFYEDQMALWGPIVKASGAKVE